MFCWLHRVLLELDLFFRTGCFCLDSGSRLSFNTTSDEVESDSIKEYQICSHGYMGSCSNWTFFSGLTVIVSIVDSVEACLLPIKPLTSWNSIELGGQWVCCKSMKNSDPFWRSHPFKWSTSDHEPKLVTLLINKWSPILKLPAMCIVHGWKQSLLGPHNPLVAPGPSNWLNLW